MSPDKDSRDFLKQLLYVCQWRSRGFKNGAVKTIKQNFVRSKFTKLRNTIERNASNVARSV